MKRIKLTQGKVAFVDNIDYEWLNQWKWRALKNWHTYYAIRSKDPIAMHRLILGLTKGDGKQTDHINFNGLDNCRQNIRIVTRSQNNHHRRSFSGSSLYKGVTWQINRGKWQAQIRYNNKRIYIGTFRNEIDAAKAYNKKANELFGEFAHLNF